jgi:tetratricopeptide (TPR) repeat protein
MKKHIITLLILLMASTLLNARSEEAEDWLTRYLDCQGDTTCQTAALLETALPLLQTDDGYVPPPPAAYELSSAIEAFQEGDIDAAIEAYQAIEDEGYMNPMVFYSLALLHEANGDTDLALDYYHQSITTHAHNPMFYFSRGRFYAAQGDADLAAYDYRMMESVNDTFSERATEYIRLLMTDYPINYETGEEWLIYPILEISGGVGGSGATDITDISPEPAGLFLDEENGLLILFSLDGSDKEFYILHEFDETTYMLERRDYWSSFSTFEHITLTRGDDRYDGTYQAVFFESMNAVTFIMLPPDEPDPRAALPRCKDGFLMRLTVGDTAQVTSGVVTEIEVYAEPGDDQSLTREVMPFHTFEIIEGPECIDEIAWWRLSSEGDTFWTPETNEFGEYSLIRVEEIEQ